MAHSSLTRNNVMRDQRCSYVVVHEDATDPQELRGFAAYLSSLSSAGCEVVIVDDSAHFERNRRIFRWVGRHVAPMPRHRSLNGTVDVMRAAQDLASHDKIIVANARVRHDAATLDAMCSLLASAAVVGPRGAR